MYSYLLMQNHDLALFPSRGKREADIGSIEGVSWEAVLEAVPLVSVLAQLFSTLHVSHTKTVVHLFALSVKLTLVTLYICITLVLNRAA